MNKEFIELAQEIDAKINLSNWFLCADLPYDKAKFVEKHFKPTDQEMYEYDILSYVWCRQRGAPFHQDNQFRIMVLLFADLMWRDEYGEDY